MASRDTCSISSSDTNTDHFPFTSLPAEIQGMIVAEHYADLYAKKPRIIKATLNHRTKPPTYCFAETHVDGIAVHVSHRQLLPGRRDFLRLVSKQLQLECDRISKRYPVRLQPIDSIRYSNPFVVLNSIATTPGFEGLCCLITELDLTAHAAWNLNKFGVENAEGTLVSNTKPQYLTGIGKLIACFPNIKHIYLPFTVIKSKFTDENRIHITQERWRMTKCTTFNPYDEIIPLSLALDIHTVYCELKELGRHDININILGRIDWRSSLLAPHGAPFVGTSHHRWSFQAK